MDSPTTKCTYTYVFLLIISVLIVIPLTLISIPIRIMYKTDNLISLFAISLLVYASLFLGFCGVYMFFTSNVDVKAIGFMFWIYAFFILIIYILYKADTKSNYKKNIVKIKKNCNNIHYIN